MQVKPPVGPPRNNNPVVYRSPNPPRNTYLSQTRKKFLCIFCLEPHASSLCQNYSSIHNRKKRLVQLSRCEICARLGHLSKSCVVKVYCSDCRGDNHHPFLCPSRSNKESNLDKAPTTSATMSQIVSNNDLVLLKCVKIIVSNPNNPNISLNALVLLDDGSTTSYINSSFAKRLRLSSLKSEFIKFNIFNETSSRELKTDVVSFEIKLSKRNTVN